MRRLEKGLGFPLESYRASHSIGAEMDMVIDIKGNREMEETEWFSDGGREERKKEEGGKWERCKTTKGTGEKRREERGRKE